jgi:hypothetical protein
MSMTEPEVRSVLTTWGEERLLAVKGFGESLTCHSIVESAAHRFVLQTQYETIESGIVTAPAISPLPPQGPIAPQGTPEDSRKELSNIEQIKQERSFTDSKHVVVNHESHRIIKCNSCTGTGQLNCGECKSQGHTKCRWCNGSGFRSVLKPRSAMDGRGRMTTTTQYVTEMCPSCRQGKIPCSNCHGKGHIPCGLCGSHGSIHVWNTSSHNFETRRNERFSNDSELQDQIVQETQGELVWNDFVGQDKPLPPLSTHLKGDLQSLLTQDGSPSSPTAKVLFQQLLLTRIPIYYVVYSAGHTSKAHLWIVGTDRHVHAPSETGVRGLWNRLTR